VALEAAAEVPERAIVPVSAELGRARGWRIAQRSVEHPLAHVDLLAQAQDHRRELGRVARSEPGAERGQPVPERAPPAHRSPGDDLRQAQAPERQQAAIRAGRPGRRSVVVH